MKRVIVNVILAAVVALAVFCALSVLIVAILGEMESELLKNLLIAIICTAAYAVSLLCLSKVRGGVGADELFDEDYAEEEYSSVRHDMKRMVRRERCCVLTMWGIMLLCYLMNLVYMEAFDGERIFPISFAFIAMTVWQNLFAAGEMNFLLNLVGHLISAMLIPAAYLLAVLVYRRHLWNSRYSIRTAHTVKRGKHYYGQFRKR